MSRRDNLTGKIMAGIRRVAALRSEQKASGDPVIACGLCRGDTRFWGDMRLVQCETCGAYLLHEDPDAGGRVRQILLCAGPPP